MNLKRLDVALIVVALVLLGPLTFSWANYAAPLLALLGVILGAGVIVVRCSMNLATPDASHGVASIPRTQVIEASIDNPRHRRLAHPTQDVLPEQSPVKRQNRLLSGWLWLWNHPNHGAVMLGCLGWIICPLDGDPIVIFGWADDLAALILLFKHASDVYELKWGKSPERMLAEHAKDLVTTANISEMGVLASASSPETSLAQSPR